MVVLLLGVDSRFEAEADVSRRCNDGVTLADERDEKERSVKNVDRQRLVDEGPGGGRG